MPQASDSTMNSGASTADWYACRATRKPKIEPVPVVRMNRHTSTAMPAGFVQRASPGSNMVHRYTITTPAMPEYRNTFQANTERKL